MSETEDITGRSPMKERAGPLSDVTIIDCTMALAGPFFSSQAATCSVLVGHDPRAQPLFQISTESMSRACQGHGSFG